MNNFYSSPLQSIRNIAKTIGTLTLILCSGCMVVDTAVRDSMSNAISSSIDRKVEGWMTGYTDAMFYQLAYTQVFALGGFGTNPNSFEIGEGATWKIESVSPDEEGGMFTAERALLSRTDNGDSWWYLKYTPDSQDEEDMFFEYEVLIDKTMQAREMYVRDYESKDVRHHVFEASDIEEAEINEAALQEDGYSTRPIYLQDREEYTRDKVFVQLGSGNYDADLLVYTHEDPDTQESFEYRWWVSENVPGELIKFEYGDVTRDNMLRGELVNMQNDYRHRLASFE
ncbi:MAG: hypothetical protein WD267_13920 [Balneolales bacterium]